MVGMRYVLGVKSTVGDVGTYPVYVRKFCTCGTILKKRTYTGYVPTLNACTDFFIGTRPFPP